MLAVEPISFDHFDEKISNTAEQQKEICVDLNTFTGKSQVEIESKFKQISKKIIDLHHFFCLNETEIKTILKCVPKHANTLRIKHGNVLTDYQKYVTLFYFLPFHIQFVDLSQCTFAKPNMGKNLANLLKKIPFSVTGLSLNNLLGIYDYKKEDIINIIQAIPSHIKILSLSHNHFNIPFSDFIEIIQSIPNSITILYLNDITGFDPFNNTHLSEILSALPSNIHTLYFANNELFLQNRFSTGNEEKEIKDFNEVMNSFPSSIKKIGIRLCKLNLIKQSNKHLELFFKRFPPEQVILLDYTNSPMSGVCQLPSTKTILKKNGIRVPPASLKSITSFFISRNKALCKKGQKLLPVELKQELEVHTYHSSHPSVF